VARCVRAGRDVLLAALGVVPVGKQVREDAADQRLERHGASTNDGRVQLDGRPDGDDDRVPGRVRGRAERDDPREAHNAHDDDAAQRVVGLAGPLEGRWGSSHDSEGEQQDDADLAAPGHVEGYQERHREHQNHDLGEQVDADVDPHGDRLRPAPGVGMGGVVPIGCHGHAGKDGVEEGEAAEQGDEDDGGIAESLEENRAEDAEVQDQDRELDGQQAKGV